MGARRRFTRMATAGHDLDNGHGPVQQDRVGTPIPAAWHGLEGLVCGFGRCGVEPPLPTLTCATQVHGRLILEDSSTNRALLGPDGGCGHSTASGHAPSASGDSRVAADVAADVAGDVAADASASQPSAASAVATEVAVAPDADGLVSAHAGLVVGVRTADCVPLLFLAPGSRWSAAVHAGWRGTLARIAAGAVEAAAGAGVDAADLQVAVGPSIGPCCYQVGEEVAGPFEEQGLPVLRTPSQTARLDLRAINRLILLQAGVAADSIHLCGPCTCCTCFTGARYHSWRARPGTMGRQLSWIGWRGDSPSR